MPFDTAAQVQMVVRKVEDVTHEGRSARAVVATRDYATDIDDLWDAITDKERIPRWFAPVEGELALGGRYQIKGNAGGTVTACDPPRSFALTWEFGGGMSWVEVELAEAGEATRLTLRHIAPLDDKSEEFWDRFGPGAVGVGWDLSLMGLAWQYRDRREQRALRRRDLGAERRGQGLHHPEQRRLDRGVDRLWHRGGRSDPHRRQHDGLLYRRRRARMMTSA